MAEKLIPDVEVFAQEIAAESRQSLSTQRLNVAEQLLNFSPDKISELHLQDWYSQFWKILDVSPYVSKPQENDAKTAAQILQSAQTETNPTRRQYLALALLLFGEMQQFHALADKKLWSPNLRDDFEIFSKFNRMVGFSSNFEARAHIRRNLQIKNFLAQKYADLIKKYANATLDKCPKVSSKNYRIYFSWLQGEDNLPPLIRCCYNSLKMNAGRYPIVFIDEKNYADHVQIPNYIIKKVEEGKISRTHFSDVVRINLLEQYGGLWLDATILVTEPLENYKQFWKLPYFTQKFLQEKDNYSQFISTPSYGRWGSFIQGTATLHNPLFAFEKEFYNVYWEEYDEIIDYVLMDFMMDMAYENIPAVRKEFDAVPINNNRAWSLLGILGMPYAQYPYDKIFKGNFLNKLNWKADLDWKTPGTVLKEIQRRYAPETLTE